MAQAMRRRLPAAISASPLPPGVRRRVAEAAPAPVPPLAAVRCPTHAGIGSSFVMAEERVIFVSPDRVARLAVRASDPHRRSSLAVGGGVAVAQSLRNAHRSDGPAQGRAGLDWGDLRFFLELARTGSLSRAARRLGVDRNTVGRRVASLEETLGLTLFERGPQGWSRTAAGDELAELATRVEENVLALARHADAADRDLAGTVRLTTPTHVCAQLLAPALPSLRERHPRLLLEVAVDQRIFDLTRREADLALRLGRPRETGLVMRKLGEVAYGLYAARGQPAARRGRVDFEADPFVGFDDSLASVPQERWLARVAPVRKLVFRCNSSLSLVAAVKAGMGVAVLPCFVAAADPGLVRLEAPEPVQHELWILFHGDLGRTPRVRAVIDWVDEVVRAARPALLGTPS